MIPECLIDGCWNLRPLFKDLFQLTLSDSQQTGTRFQKPSSRSSKNSGQKVVWFSASSSHIYFAVSERDDL